MKKKLNRKGFTLVELIVVIAILAILAGVAIPVYSGYIKKANEAADYQQLDSIKTAAVFAATDNAIPQGFELVKITVATDATGKVTGFTVNGKTGDAAAADVTGLDNAIKTLLGGEMPTLKSDTFKGGAVYQAVSGEMKWVDTTTAAGGSTSTSTSVSTSTNP